MMLSAVLLIIVVFPVSEQFETLKTFQFKKDKQTNFQSQQSYPQGQQTDLQGLASVYLFMLEEVFLPGNVDWPLSSSLSWQRKRAAWFETEQNPIRY